MSAELVLYAVIAAGLIVWLKNILGTRHGEERERPNPFTEAETQQKDAQSKKTAVADHDNGSVPIPAAAMAGVTDENHGMDNLDRSMSIDKSAEQGIQDIIRKDRDFNVKEFLNGAQDAFVYIVEGFAARDRAMLQNLTAPDVYKAFASVIDDREKDEITAEVEIHAVRKSELIEARLVKNMAFVTVRFTADETSILRDKDGKVTFGDPDRVTETIDIWTFGRNIRSGDPTWLLYETRECEEDELAGSTVPEADGK